MNTWNFIKKEIENDNNIVLITVADRKGSSPGIVGFKLAVSESGEIIGSIGGGIMEFNMVELARKILKKGEKEAFIKRQIHNPEALNDKSGLICSGEQTHIFTFLDDTNIETIRSIAVVLNNGGNGALSLTQHGISFDDKQSLTGKSKFVNEKANGWKYAEQIGLKPTVYIFGAGHVSLPLSKLISLLDFNVVLFDNRNNLNTFKDNQFVYKKDIIDYGEATKYVPEGENSYVVIITFGHKSDQLILEQLITKNIKYLGMMGSQSKVSKIFDSLRKKNISEAFLERVDAPIGLPINSETTEEIAVSIAAKIIQVKNTK